MLLGMIALALSQANLQTPVPSDEFPPSISRELHYIHPASNGQFSCNGRIWQQQEEEFTERFQSRIRILIRNWEAAHGPDPGYEFVAIGGRCVENLYNADERFQPGMRQFARRLAILEARYNPR